MRRLARHLFTLCSAVSLLLCVAVCVLWVRSYQVAEGYIATTVGEDAAYTRLVLNKRGTLRIGRWVHERWAKSPDANWVSEEADPDEPSVMPLSSDFTFAGFRYATLAARPGFLRGGTLYAVPWWFVLAVTLLPPMTWARRWHRYRRLARSGRCVRCGYDLRATPGRCPECGAAAANFAPVLPSLPTASPWARR